MFKFGGLLGYSWGFSVVDNHTACAALKVLPEDKTFCKKLHLGEVCLFLHGPSSSLSSLVFINVRAVMGGLVPVGKPGELGVA